MSGDDESVIEACEQAFHVLAFSARPNASATANAKSGFVTPPVVARISDRPTFRPSQAPSYAPPLESEVVPRSDRNPGIANVAEGTPPSSRRGLQRVVGNR